MSLLDAKEERLLDWLLLPESMREPATKAALAAELDVHPSTLTAWQKNHHFDAEYNRRWRKVRGSAENVQKVIDKLHTKALDGDNQSMKLYLEWAKELKKEEPTDTGPSDLREMTDAELAENLKAVLGP